MGGSGEGGGLDGERGGRGRLVEPPGASWWPLEAIRDRLGAILGSLGAILAVLEDMLDRIGGHIAAAILIILEAILAVSWRQSWPSWSSSWAI